MIKKFNEICKIIDRNFCIGRIPITLVSYQNDSLYCQPQSQNYILSNALFQSIMSAYYACDTEHSVFIFNCFYQCYIGLLVFDDYLLFLGPVSSHTLTPQVLSKCCHSRLSSKEIMHICQMCNSSSTYTHDQFANILSLIHEQIFQEYIHPDEIMTFPHDKSYGKNSAPRPPICSVCEKYITNHIHLPIKLTDLAKACGFSERQLQRIFKKYFGMTATEYINQEKLQYAASLLCSGNYSVSEVSSSLGYISQSYFTKKFKEMYACTPTEYMHANK